MSAPYNTQQSSQPNQETKRIGPEKSGFARADARRVEAGLSFEKVLKHARAKHLTYARAVEKLVRTKEERR